MSVTIPLDRDTVAQARRFKRQTSLIAYTKHMYPGYQAGPIHYEIARFLERAAVTPNFRGVLIVPPRFGKSLLASIMFPSWYLGRFPDREVIGASHTQSLSNHFSRAARRNVQARRWYPFPDVQIAGDAGAVEQWEVESAHTRKRGRYQAIGVGGAIAGRGADFLLIDDPVKNAEAAESFEQRESTWEWFKTDIMTRLQPYGSAVVIGTRWHHDDMIGRILKGDQELGRWEVLHHPALKRDGTSLDPVRWPLDQLVERRRDVGERVWEALYQGNPTPDEGALLKKDWFPLYNLLPEGVLYTIQSWDTAYKTDPKNDFSVCHTYAVTTYGLFLVGRFKGKLEYPELEREAERQFLQFKPKYVLIEDKSSGISLGQSLRKKRVAGEVVPVVMIPVPPGDGKIQRVHDATPMLETKRVFLPEWAPWTDDVLAEFTAFPLGEHDDEVDAMIQAVHREFGGAHKPEAITTSYLPDPDENDELDDYPMRR